MRPVGIFLVIAYSLSIALSLVVFFTGGRHSPLIGLGYLTMLCPALAAGIVSRTIGEPTRIDWSKLPTRYLPAALLLIPTVLHLSMLPAMIAAAGRLPWSSEIDWRQIVGNALFGLVVVSALALFEEIGWRGWLLPHLMDRYSARAAIVFTSIAWAMWHLPFVFSGILWIQDVSTPWTALLVPLGTLGAGLIIGWLWTQTDSIWIAALAHGALNSWGQFAFKYMQAPPRVDLRVILLAGAVGLLATGAILIGRGRAKQTGHQFPGSRAAAA